MIQNFGELKAAVTKWIDRSDLGAVIRDICFLGIRRVYRDTRCPSNERLVTYGHPKTDFLKRLQIPADYLQLRLLSCDGEPLTRVSDREIHKLMMNPESGAPTVFGRVGGVFAIHPVPIKAHTFGLWYWSDEADLLKDDEASTRLLQDAGELFLYACLSEAENYLVNDTRVAMWEGRYTQALARLKAQVHRDEYSGGQLIMRGANG